MVSKTSKLLKFLNYFVQSKHPNLKKLPNPLQSKLKCLNISKILLIKQVLDISYLSPPLSADLQHLYKGTMFLNWITYLTRLVFILCLSDSIVQWPPPRRYSPQRRLTSKELFTLFVLILGHFWCSVVTSVTLSSNISNFEKKQKKSKKI